MSGHGFSLDPNHVEGNLFNENGKWKYTVLLDYSEGDWCTWDLWEEARKALRLATENEISGVTLKEIPSGWVMVVLNPRSKHSHPIIVKGEK